jgi:TonB family protein
MNILRKLPLLAALGIVATARLSAGVESFKIEPTVDPQYSASMQMEGVTEGTVIFAIEVSAEGKLTDHLVLGYTHPGLVSPCVDALTRWKFTPAKVDGVPVAVQAEITLNFKAEGVVISTPSVLEISNHLQRIFGYKLQAHPCSAAELDSAPTRVNTVMPAYAKEAAKQGVHGTVQVHFYIDQTGAVRMPAVDGASHPYLSNIAVDAVREWRFAPPTSRGKPVLVTAVQDFQFSK